MTGMYDGYQVFKKGLNGYLLPVTGIFGDFKTAVGEKLELAKADPQHIYEIHGIYNLNNNK